MNRIFCLFFLILLPWLAIQAKPSDNTISVHDGLAHYSVQCIVQDKYGFMWFATNNGLTRYDGYHLKTYQTSSSNPNSIPNNRIQLIYIDANKDLWISSFNGSICKYDYQNDNFIRYALKDVPKLIQDSTNRFINKSRQYACGAGKQFLIYENKYLIIKDIQKATRINPRDFLPNTIDKLDFNCVFIDKTNVLWIGTNFYGVVKIDLMANPFQKKETSSKSAIQCIFKDQTKLYLGTFEDGIILNKTSFRQNIANHRVRSMYKDAFGKLWIGYNTGLDWIDSQTDKLIPVSLRGNITKYNKSEWEKMQTLPNRNYLCIAQDQTNTIWLGTDKGIFKYNRENNTFHFIDLSEYTHNSIVSQILSDSKNRLWIATEGSGIIVLDKEKVIQNYHFEDRNPNSLADDRVCTLQEDNLGFVWVGTENGLCRINPQTKTVQTFTQNNGLADGGIACLLVDKHNQLWFSHKKGISKIDIHTFAIKNYTVDVIDNNGLFLNRSGFYDKEQDCIYFGYSEGYIYFSPNEIHDNSIPPIAQLVELKIDNQLVGVNQVINDRIILREPLYQTTAITLTHHEKTISIEFTAIHFANPEANHFQYKLEGFDKNWISSRSDNRTATYSNLKAGNYTFKVRVSNANNIWCEKEVQLQILVETPWWFRWWAIGIYVAFVSGILYLFVSMLLSKQKVEHLLEVEKVKAEQIKEFAQIRSNFFTKISHELRTPLTLILDPIKRLSIDTTNPQEVFKKNVIQRNAERLLTLVNELLDVRKAEEGLLTLNLQSADLYLLVREVANAFLYNSENRSISIELISDLQVLQMQFDRERMETVLYNLLSNAVKNSNDNSTIHLTIQVKEDSIELSIQNEGKTIEPTELNKIFEPFYQINSGIQGTGLGLTITKEIVELHGGKISVTSANGQTLFTICLPYVAAPKKTTNKSKEDLPLLLLIEDNSDIRNYIKSELENRFQILEAENGEIGIEIAKTKIPDLILTDVMMPLKNGFEVCTEIKNDIRTCHIPIIILTARQSEQSYIEGYETGADSYISKPFSLQVLETRINNLLNNRQKLSTYFKGEDKPSESSTESEFLIELKRKILNSNEMYNVEVLAESMNMSRSQLYRKIKTLTQQSASDFISEIRMNYACQLLKEGKYNISEIALKLGYSEQANFSRSFFRYFGKYPSQYLS